MDLKKENTLGERIEFIIYKFNLNNDKLGEMAGVSGTAIADLIKKEVNPRVSVIKNISSKLDLSYDWLIEGKGVMIKRSNTKEVKLITTLQEPKDPIDHVMDLVTQLQEKLDDQVIKSIVIENELKTLRKEYKELKKKLA